MGLPTIFSSGRGARIGSGRVALAAAGLVLALLRPDFAAAHAILLRGVPTAGGTLPAGHAVIDLQFNSRIEHKASQLQLEAPDGTRAKLALGDSAPDVLHAEVDLVPGPYTLRWQVLALDGHLTRGAIPFTAVKRPSPVAANTPIR